MLEEVKWGEFKIGDLFEVDSWEYGKNQQYDKKSEQKKQNSIAVVSGITTNNGVAYYTEDIIDKTKIFEHELTITTRGEYSGTVFYHGYKFALANNILVMFMKKMSRNQKIFLGSIINALGYKGYDGYPRKATLKNDIIKLPILENGNINFSFMEKFIAELEATHIAELDAYFSVTGLKDYELTQEEIRVLDEFENIKWETFRMGDLFDRLKTIKLPYKAEDLPKYPTMKYKLPCLTSSFHNQGLNYYAPIEGATILKNVISIPSNSDVYRAYFQSNNFTILSDAYAIDWISNKFSEFSYSSLFAVTCINKVTNLPIYSYKNKLGGWNVVKDKNIKLPTNSNQINYKFMQTLISAIQKLVIKDVVLWSEKKISATKSVIEK